MHIICSTAGIVHLKHPQQGILDMQKAKFRELFFDFSSVYDKNELEAIHNGRLDQIGEKNSILKNPNVLHDRMQLLIQQCKKNDIQMSFARAPRFPQNPNVEEMYSLYCKLVEYSIQICGELGISYVIVSPLYWQEMHENEIWQINKSYFLNLAAIAKKFNVMILLENTYRNINGHPVRGICFNSSEIVEWIDALNDECGQDQERFGFCMDVGIGTICGQNMYDCIVSIGKRLKAIILRDSDRYQENALLPFTSISKKGKSNTDWSDVIRGLREIDFDGTVILYFRDTVKAFSPLLRIPLLSLAKQVGDFFEWQIQLENQLKKYPTRVLFGAGNMCRNYMKHYGDKYPPLFTCDNNQTLWGSTLCGLEVKSPQNLYHLPKDCVIMICNTYYREIEQQLKEMHIQNPIAFFNDEYMPTEYFDI